ncbi:protein of unknown function [Jatrophihabitans endophyticus]|uniref:HNH nuclease domain-containing protein n=1 Tax=Jatrophihabitans endophyticus TaxID=1206085 RepID=A0A1M5E6V7_9ACTN|nr:HNH endonuclease signature motif containing protein [Jatrophihabitans endophyticus]SHF74802.1 protein of unknown function [Jatrophihabitans endophyticus]
MTTTLGDAADSLLTTELSSWDESCLLDTWREVERLRNRLAAMEHRFVAEAERRGLPFTYGARNTAAFVRALLRVHPREAVARVAAASAAAPVTTLTGEVVPAPFPRVAAAQAEGTISPRHAQTIVAAVERLPDVVQVEHGARVEQDLVEYAEQFDPHQLGTLALRVTTLLDQDGTLADVAYRERHRDLTIRQRPDGSASITGEATAELAERLLTVLDALAAPRPAEGGVRDPRTAGQRRHDGLLDALDLVQRAELLPTVAGISTTVLLTASAEDWQTGGGVTTTGHGAILPTREAIRLSGGDTRVMNVDLDGHGAVTGHTDARRLFTETQRLALIARDGGCTFPGCDVPPAWTQAHHVIDHARGGPTTIANGTLVCGHHHRHHQRQGWQSVMRDGRPAWLPPPWLDPHRRPRTNPRYRTGADRTD